MICPIDKEMCGWRCQTPCKREVKPAETCPACEGSGLDELLRDGRTPCPECHARFTSEKP